VSFIPEIDVAVRVFYPPRSTLQCVSFIPDNARWYGPSTGRFLTQDPKGFAAGDTDLYSYVGNAPTNATDPRGLDVVTAVVTTSVGAMTVLAGVAAAPIAINLAVVGVVAAGAVATKTLYVQMNEALADLQTAQAESARLDARLMQLQLARMNAQLVAMAAKLPEGYENLTLYKMQSFMLSLGQIPPGAPKGMDPKKWKEELDKMIKNMEDYLKKIGAKKPPTRGV
jgi:hypothetical protein